MKKKLFPILLSMIFIFSSMMTITVFAANPVIQDGMKATIITSKQTYEANEDIDLHLAVENCNFHVVNNIETCITLPDGITLKDGSLTQEVFDQESGVTNDNFLTVIKNVAITPTEDTTPQSNAQTDSSESSSITVSNTEVETPTIDTTTPNSPQTGEGIQVSLWFILMLSSASVLILLGIKYKKIRSNGILSLFFGSMLFALMASPFTVNAVGTPKSFTVTTDLIVDGETVTVSAEISYTYEAYNEVVVINGSGTNLYAEDNTVTITADTAQEGYHFTGWTVECGGITLDNASDEITTFTMGTEYVRVRANYEVNTYTINVIESLDGAVTPAGETNVVNHGEDKTFTITANDGYHVVDVLADGASVGAVPSYTFDNVTDNHTISVTFAKDTYTVTVSNGSVQDNTTTVAWGETVTIVADTLLAGDSFIGWTVVAGGATLSDSTQTTTTFMMPQADVMVTANIIWDGTTIATAYNSGTGTQADPYMITSGAQLAYLAQQVNTGTSYSGTYFKLSNDINLNDKEWTPIGKDETNTFVGNFDGNGKSISGMKIISGGKDFSGTNYYLGLFGCVNGGSVTKLSTNGVIAPEQFESGLNYVGGIIGYLKSGTVSNLSADVTMTAKSGAFSAGEVYVGGAIGRSDVEFDTSVFSVSILLTCDQIDGETDWYIGHNVGWCNNSQTANSPYDKSDASFMLKYGGIYEGTTYINGNSVTS